MRTSWMHPLCHHCALPQMNCSCDNDSGFAPPLQVVEEQRRLEKIEKLLKKGPFKSEAARGRAEIYNDGVKAAFRSIYGDH